MLMIIILFIILDPFKPNDPELEDDQVIYDFTKFRIGMISKKN